MPDMKNSEDGSTLKGLCHFAHNAIYLLWNLSYYSSAKIRAPSRTDMFEKLFG